MELKDKIPPHSLEAEQATLGAMLLDWDSVGEVVSFLRANHFYDLRNQLIFDSLVHLSIDGVKGDMLTLIDDLTKKGKLEEAGGVSYISSLTGQVPTSANIAYYGNIVAAILSASHRKSRHRALTRLTQAVRFWRRPSRKSSS